MLFNLAERFANGVPAVSDQSMSDWMAYVHQQKPMPANTTGVLVSINVVDSNGNYQFKQHIQHSMDI